MNHHRTSDGALVGAVLLVVALLATAAVTPSDFWFIAFFVVGSGAVAFVLSLLRDTLRERRREPQPDAGLSIFDGEWSESADTARIPIARSPLARAPSLEELDTAERAGQFAEFYTALLTGAEAKLYGTGRHRAVGNRDPRRASAMLDTCSMPAIGPDTEQFLAVAAHAGHPVEVLGPDEDWQQLTLPLRGLPPRIGEVRS